MWITSFINRWRRPLTILETVVATAIYIYIAAYFETLVHFAIAVFLCPFLLLRSPESHVDGIEFFESKALKRSASVARRSLVIEFGRLLIIALYCRVKFTLRHAASGVKQIPTNWIRVFADESVFSELTYVPGTGSIRQNFQTVSGDNRTIGDVVHGSTSAWLGVAVISVFILFILAWRDTSQTESLYPDMLRVVLAIVIVFSLLYSATIVLLVSATFLLAFWYRVSLKATAIIWLPLVYLVKRSTKNYSDLDSAIEDECVSAISKLGRMIAWFIFAFVFWRVAIYPNISKTLNDQPWIRIFDAFVSPTGIDNWHIASGINAILVLGSFYLFFTQRPGNLVKVVRYRNLSEHTTESISGFAA